MGTGRALPSWVVGAALAALPVVLATAFAGALDERHSPLRLERAHTPTSLTDARDLPSRAVEQPFRFAITISAVERPYDALLTRFDNAHWVRCEAWGDEQQLWNSPDFANPAPYLFARRGSAAAARLLAAKPYDRLIVEGAVRQVFAREPWIEVWSVQSAEPSITEATVFHAARAIGLWRDGRSELARSELARALAAPLPEHQRQELLSIEAAWTAAAPAPASDPE